eukprot:6821147-Prymnesium_polylepis.1
MRRAAGAASSGVVGLGRATVVPRPRSGARSRRRSRSARGNGGDAPRAVSCCGAVDGAATS